MKSGIISAAVMTCGLAFVAPASAQGVKIGILNDQSGVYADYGGKYSLEAVIEACRLRLRPILMTSFAFILGVLPLVISTGSGSEMRQAVGVAVFFGMLGVTLFGLLFTPIFYMVVRNLADRRQPTKTEVAAA